MTNNDLITTLSHVVAAAFVAEGLDPALGVVTRADRPDLADFQCNGALKAAKQAASGKVAAGFPSDVAPNKNIGKNPRDIASAICARLNAAGAEHSFSHGEKEGPGARREDEGVRPHRMIERAEIAGPGFINITLTADALSARAAAIALDERAGAVPVAQPRRVVIDFGGPNIAKPMHVGHLRSSIIGDSLQRLFRFMGDAVTSDIHMGDWGLPMGMLITELAREQPDLPYFDEAYTGPYPVESPVTLDDLERLYPQAAAHCKADETRAEAARLATAALQAGRPGYRALWQHFLSVTKAALHREFAALGVSFDEWLGESDVDPLIGPMVEDLKARGISIEDDGAWIIRISAPDEEPQLAPLILVKRDGGVLYATTDLATIIDRKHRFGAQLILYVVDARQGDHFRQVFRAAERAEIIPASALEHIGFGTMNGTDGKPFKTRAGGVMKLKDLIDQAVDKARDRLREAGMGEELPEAEFEDVAHKVAIAAIKFADLQNWRAANYTFDLDRFMTFEGKTGPYLLYQAVRAQAILRKAAEQGLTPGAIAVEASAERDLVLLLDGFHAALQAAYDKRAPHLIAEHCYGLAQAFSKFYAACPILAAGHEAARPSRLALCGLMLHQLNLGLQLLGLQAPERM